MSEVKLTAEGIPMAEKYPTAEDYSAADNHLSARKISPAGITLSVVLPAYNEEEMLPRTAVAVRDAMQEADIDCEILFVDDGS